MCSFNLIAALLVFSSMCHSNKGETKSNRLEFWQGYKIRNELSRGPLTTRSTNEGEKTKKITKFEKLEFWKKEQFSNETSPQETPHFVEVKPLNKRAYLDEARRDMERLFHPISEERDVAMRYAEIEKMRAKLNARVNKEIQYRKHGNPGHVHGAHHKQKKRDKLLTIPNEFLSLLTASTPLDANVSVLSDSINLKDVLPKQDQAESYRITPWPRTSRTTRLTNRKTNLNLNISQRMHLAESEPTQNETKTETGGKSLRVAEKPIETDNVDKSEISPYSVSYFEQLYRVLNEVFIPQFEKEDINMTLEVLGRTVEYNDIVLIKATHIPSSSRFRTGDETKYDESAPEKKILFIVHGLAVMGFHMVPCLKSIGGLKKLMSFYFKHLKEFDIYLIPMANPDGVAVSAQRDYWNKNISPQAACPGVALDRNFEVAWDESLAQSSSCNQQYPGPTPFSEAESQAVRNVFHRHSHKIAGYMHVHAATYNTDVFKGDAVLYPKGFQETNTDDDKYIDLRGEIEEAVKNASFKVYSVSVDSLYSWYGRVTGTSVDYATTVYGIPFALELVMQLYDDDMMVEDSEERETNAVLNTVWSRVIEIICNFIHTTVSKPSDK